MGGFSYKRAIAVSFFLFLFLIQASSVALKKSNTWDEPAHIMAGYAYLADGLDYLSPLNHPAFGRLLLAVFPKAFLDLSFDPSVKPEGAKDSDFFPYSLKFLYENRAPGGTVLFLSRLSNIITGLILGIYIFVWSSELWGAAGGYLSLFFYALSPNIIAHSSLATTDIPITAFFFISVFYLYRISVKGITPLSTVACGIFLALAFTSKHTALLLLPLVLASFISSLKKGPPLKAASYYLILFAIVYLAVWGIYGFRYHSGSPYYQPLPWVKFSASSYAPVFDLLRKMRILPEAYLYSIAGVIFGASGGKAAFLMGDYSSAGWWYYFLVAFLIKTPVPTILFLTASVVYGLSGRVSREKVLFLLLPALLVFAAFSLQKVDIGLRHVLPAYPFIFTLIGFVPSIKTPSIRPAKAVFYTCCVWYMYSAASIYPDELAYFNEFIGGPEKGYKYLVDSNLDWGQDLKGLKDYMTANKIGSIKLAYFGFSDPKYFGIDYEYLPSYVIPGAKNVRNEVPLKGYFAISATMLQGVYLADRNTYRVFKELRPVDTIGYSIFIYKIE